MIMHFRSSTPEAGSQSPTHNTTSLHSMLDLAYRGLGEQPYYNYDDPIPMAERT
jgi:hypothetical protein